jgi:hypothetical protein
MTMPPMGHYAEVFHDDDGYWGWQCFTCGAEESGIGNTTTASYRCDDHIVVSAGGRDD